MIERRGSPPLSSFFFPTSRGVFCLTGYLLFLFLFPPSSCTPRNTGGRRFLFFSLSFGWGRVTERSLFPFFSTGRGPQAFPFPLFFVRRKVRRGLNRPLFSLRKAFFFPPLSAVPVPARRGKQNGQPPSFPAIDNRGAEALVMHLAFFSFPFFGREAGAAFAAVVKKPRICRARFFPPPGVGHGERKGPEIVSSPSPFFFFSPSIRRPAVL